MSTEGPVFRDIYEDDDEEGGEGADGQVLVAVIGPGPMVSEIVLHGPDEGQSVTHRVPRPIPLNGARNQAVNYAMDMWFDAVVLLSGPVPPWPLASTLWAVAAADPTIALVTGLESPSAGGARSWVAAQLAEEWGTEAVDIPAPSPDCMLVTLAAIRQIDQFDLKWTKGGEIDWAVRARKAGLRVVAAPAVPLGGPATEAPEGMVLFRHPQFRKEQREFLSSGTIEAVHARSAKALVQAAARSIGYTVDVTTEPRPMITHDSLARVSVRPDTAPTIDIRFAGLQAAVDLGVEISDFDAPDVLEMALGRRPEKVVIYDPGPVGERIADVWSISGVPIDDRSARPPAG